MKVGDVVRLTIEPTNDLWTDAGIREGAIGVIRAVYEEPLRSVYRVRFVVAPDCPANPAGWKLVGDELEIVEVVDEDR